MRGGAFGSLLSALAILSLQAGDFSKTCSDISVSKGGVMDAVCRTFTNEPHPTSINLNERIANIDGDLQIVGSNEDFAKSCKDLGIKDRILLKAQCKTREGEYVRAFINLDKYVENVDGNLEWDITRSLPLRKALRNHVKSVMEMEESGSSLLEPPNNEVVASE